MNMGLGVIRGVCTAFEGVLGDVVDLAIVGLVYVLGDLLGDVAGDVAGASDSGAVADRGASTGGDIVTGVSEGV